MLYPGYRETHTTSWNVGPNTDKNTSTYTRTRATKPKVEENFSLKLVMWIDHTRCCVHVHHDESENKFVILHAHTSEPNVNDHRQTKRQTTLVAYVWILKAVNNSYAFTRHRNPFTNIPGPFAQTSATTLMHCMPHLRLQKHVTIYIVIHVQMSTVRKGVTRLWNSESKSRGVRFWITECCDSNNTIGWWQ